MSLCGIRRHAAWNLAPLETCAETLREFEWRTLDVTRVAVGHGQVIEREAQRVLREASAYLL